MNKIKKFLCGVGIFVVVVVIISVIADILNRKAYSMYDEGFDDDDFDDYFDDDTLFD